MHYYLYVVCDIIDEKKDAEKGVFSLEN